MDLLRIRKSKNRNSSKKESSIFLPISKIQDWKIGIQQKIRLQPARNWGMNMSEEGGFKKKIGSLRLHQSKILVSGIFWDLNNKHGVLNHPNWGRIESNIWVSNKPTYWFNDWICRMEMPFNFLTKQMTRWTNEKWGEWGQNSDRMVDIGVQFYKLLLVRSWPISTAFQRYSHCCVTWYCLVLHHLFWADTVWPSQYYPILDVGSKGVQGEYRNHEILFIEEPVVVVQHYFIIFMHNICTNHYMHNILSPGKAQSLTYCAQCRTCRMLAVCGSF